LEVKKLKIRLFNDDIDIGKMFKIFAKGGEIMKSSEILAANLSGILPGMESIGKSQISPGTADFGAVFREMLLASSSNVEGVDPLKLISGKQIALNKKKEFRTFETVVESKLDKKNLEIIRGGFYGLKKIEKNLTETAKPKKIEKKDEAEQIQELTDGIKKLVQKWEIKDPKQLFEILKEDPTFGNLFSGMDEETLTKIAEALIESVSSEKFAESSDVLQTDESGQEKENMLLERLRKDPKDGKFWKALDDQTALALLKSFNEELGKNLAKSGEDEDNAVVPHEGELPEVISETGDSKTGEDKDSETPTSPSGKKETLVEIKEGKNKELSQKSSGHSQEMEFLKTKFDTPSNPSEDLELNVLQKELLLSRLEKPNHYKMTSVNEKTVPLSYSEGVKGVKDKGTGNFSSFFGQGSLGNSLSHLREQVRTSTFQDPVRAAVFSQIVEKAHLLKGPQEVKVLTIQLKPEFLGKVNLELTSKDGSVVARIMTENSQIRDKIEEIAPQIKSHLIDQGIKLDNLTVDVSSHNPDGNGSDFLRESAFGDFHLKSRQVPQSELNFLVEATGPVIFHNSLGAGIDITV